METLPAIESRPAALEAGLADALAAKGPDYRPRTEHLLPDGRPRYTNRLILEDSPYLIQHAHNPVDWYPWGEEAFAKAREENKPIFLSIGYSTCHWCHVMEGESFENEAIAAVLNRHFVAIKVDRESLPDVDETYMTAVQLIAGHGGWPMSSFLTPEGKPFFGGTYYRPGQFLALLNRVAALWAEQEAELRGAGEEVAGRVKRLRERRAKAGTVGHEAIAAAVKAALSEFDASNGGFGPAPKFPRESLLLLLIAEAERHPDPALIAAIDRTLDAMARGGIHDQAGGGFHRYAVDAGWLVPHFEKMLYNQAQLGRVYSLAWRLTGNPLYRNVAVRALDYVLRDMTAPGGGFYAATDADSEGGEGTFFLWTPDGIRSALPAEDAALAIEVFGITEAGNFEDANILHLPRPLDEVARRKGLTRDALLDRIDRIRDGLHRARERRPHPLRDDKIITAWNGMMITTLAQAGDLLGEPRYIEAAVRAASFLWKHNRQANGELWRVHLDGRSSVSAYQEDYAFYAEGLLHLYDATGDALWLERARTLADDMLERFWDAEGGGFWQACDEGPAAVMGRARETGSDNAMPSGSAAALRVLQMLSVRTDVVAYDDHARALLASHAGTIGRWPSGFGYLLAGGGDLLDGELGARRYAARGAIRISARRNGEGRMAVEMDIASGWHVNAHRPLQTELIATELSIGSEGIPAKVSYPGGEILQLGFQDEPLSLYQGKILLAAELETTQNRPHFLPLRLRLQACDDRSCLPPEDIALGVPMSGPVFGK